MIVCEALVFGDTEGGIFLRKKLNSQFLRLIITFFKT